MRPGLTPVGCLLLALAVGCSAAHARNKELTATFGLRTGVASMRRRGRKAGDMIGSCKGKSSEGRPRRLIMKP